VLFDDGYRLGFLCLEEVGRIDQSPDQKPGLVFLILYVGRCCRCLLHFTWALIRVKQPRPSYRLWSTLEIVSTTRATYKKTLSAMRGAL
jgi:hypothetical protein